MVDAQPYSEEAWAKEDFENAYRNWMYRRMKASGYEILFDILFDTKFVWDPDIPRDEDRAANGRFLRIRFSDESGMELEDDWLEDDCSFLEFMVALALSIEDKIMYDPEFPDQEADWFWMMMDNCGLAKYDDTRMNREGYSAFKDVSDIVMAIMERDYGFNGYPGLFPLAKPKQDQRTVEIWYQANAYMIENFFD